MSGTNKIARLLVLGTICSGVAFADGHPRQYFSDLGRHEGSPSDAQVVPEFASGRLSFPQSASYLSYPPNHKTNTLFSLEPLGDSAPDFQIAPQTKSAKLALPDPVPLPAPASRGDFAVPLAEPFDLPATNARPGVVPAKWADLQTRLLADEKTIAACRSGEAACSQAATRFLSIVEIGRKHQGRARLGWINRAVNLRIKPMDDWAQYGYADFWSSPLETLSSAAGDCEDYAMVKYAALRELGVTPGDLRLLIVQDNTQQSQHAVLAVRDENNWLILDNRTMTLVTPERARHYYPLFVMDYRGVRTFSTVAALR